MLVGFVLGGGVFAIPAYAVAPQSFRYFLRFHADRTPSRGSILFFLSRDLDMKPWLSRAADARLSNLVGTLALVVALVLLVAWTARGRVGAIAACALATIAFMVTNKIYSPQYDLWLVPFLVMLPVRTKLVLHFYVSSTAVWLLTAVTPNLLPGVSGFYLVGIAVVYRLAVLALLARDFWRLEPPETPARPVVTIQPSIDLSARDERREPVDD